MLFSYTTIIIIITCIVSFDSNSWIAIDLKKENIFCKNDDLWKEVLSNRGGKLKAIANFPINPTDN